MSQAPELLRTVLERVVPAVLAGGAGFALGYRYGRRSRADIRASSSSSSEPRDALRSAPDNEPTRPG